MATTVTNKGQVTIPKPACDLLGIAPGSTVELELALDGRVVLTRADGVARGTNGQAERMNRTVKDATTRAFHDETTDSLHAHVLDFVSAYNCAKHLKALRWRTPFQTICDAWKADPSPFRINPHHLTPGPNT